MHGSQRLDRRHAIDFGSCDFLCRAQSRHCICGQRRAGRDQRRAFACRLRVDLCMAVSGWIVGMPLTSGPVIFFVALSHDTVFAANAALGVISGGLSLVAYALTYAWLATRFRWYIAWAGSFLVFGISTTLLQNITFPLIPVFFIVCAAIVLGLRIMPNHEVEESEAELGPWDIPS